MTAERAQSGSRDLRLDLFRGLANWAIFLDHVPNNAVAWITARNYGFSDAAELFVFVSGYTAALVYTRMARARGFLAAVVGILGRAWQLYIAYILLFAFYVVTIGYVAQRYGHAHLLDEFNIRLLIRDPVEFLKHGLLLEYKPLNLDVLPLYIALMVALPLLLWVLIRWPNIALVISAGVYIAAQAGCNLRAYPAGHWYFNPFAWQFLFVIGAWVAVGGATAARALINSKTTLAVAGLFLLFAAFVTLATRTGHQNLILDTVRSTFIPNDKTNLAPYRIVHFLAVAIVISRLIPKDAPFLSTSWLRPLRLCGERSLEVFCAGVFLAFVAYFAIHLVSDSLAFQIVISTAGIGIMISIAYFKTWARDFRAAFDRRPVEREASPQPRLARREL